MTFIDSKMLTEILLFIRTRTRSQDTINEEYTLKFLLIVVLGILHYAFLILGGLCFYQAYALLGGGKS